MRIELLLLGVSGILMANIYSEGVYFKQLLTYKKYFQMAGIAFGAFTIYWLLTKNPQRASQLIASSHEYLKYLPIDQDASRLLTPILDFTAKQSLPPQPVQPIQPIQGGRKPTKRAVSETKKKFVAAQQNWTCGHCKKQLTASYEVDHILRLEYGGSNEIQNLVALCRLCHGEKTTIENL